MHKRLFNEAVIKLTISPVGPILIKAGEGASDPARPDMSFVRTSRDGEPTVYLPGSSLKGVIRAHGERLARTVGDHIACDPLHKTNSCGARLQELDKPNKKEKKGEEAPKEADKLLGARKHKESCFLCRMFGNTSLASHLQIADAYPAGECRTEERNGVAIDRVFGSVIAGGLFNYETVTNGEFQTTIRLKNFTLAQLGLLALTLRDLAAERVRLGFGKSRGLGLVTARVDALTLRYPLFDLDEGGELRLLGGAREVNGKPLEKNRLYGVGWFVPSEGDGAARTGESREDYDYPDADEAALPDGYSYVPDPEWLEVEVSVPKLAGEGADWQPLGHTCVPKWKEYVTNGKRA